MKGQTLYVQKNMTEGFFVDEDAKVVFIQTNSGKTTTELATGSDEVQHFIDDLNKKDNAKYSFVISAILENGAAKVVVIRDDTDNTFVAGEETKPSSVGYKVADKLDGIALSITYASGKITVKNGQVIDNDGANKAFGANATLTAKVEKIEGGWAEFATFTATVVPGTPSNVFADGTTGADITTGTLPNGNYRVTVTLSDNTIGTLAVGNATMFSIP